jgi:hypothetical protein
VTGHTVSAGGHGSPLRVGQGPALLHRAREAAARWQRVRDRGQERRLVGEGEQGLEQQNHVETTAREGRDPRDLEPAREAGGRARAISIALGLESTPRQVQPSSAVMNRPGPATPQHRSSTETPGATPAATASSRISLARMKLSWPTNSPGA